MLELPPLSLYVHIPWCVKKCPYCDFNSHEAKTTIPETDYINALCEDFDRELDRISLRSLDSIFIGGGTPSLFSAKGIERLLTHLQSRISFSDDIEITLEANPGTAEAIKFRDFFSAGINRLSIGVQSFDDKKLQALGRVHDSTQARLALDFAAQAGFSNFNLDLMHGLPGQSPEEALQDLQIALQFKPPHLSWYQLTVEPNTVFYSRPPSLPDEGLLEEIQQIGEAQLSQAGLERYEVSAFSQANRRSRHNLNYWQFGDYIGIGAGAHGKITQPAQATIARTRKHKQPLHYLRNDVNRDAEMSVISEQELPLEFLLNGLRLRDGFDVTMFESRTGLSFSVVSKQIEYLITNDLLIKDDNRVSASDKGYRFLNSVLEEFL